MEQDRHTKEAHEQLTAFHQEYESYLGKFDTVYKALSSQSQKPGRGKKTKKGNKPPTKVKGKKARNNPIDFFLAGHQVSISGNINKMRTLFFDQLQQGKYDDEMLSNPEFPKVALALFIAKAISPIQLRTLLQLHQLFRTRVICWVSKNELDYNLLSKAIDIKIYAIFDKKGEFTQQAKKYLLSQIRKEDPAESYMIHQWDENYKDRFKAMLRHLPPSENVFVLRKANPEETDTDGKTIRPLLHQTKTIMQYGEYDIFMSTGAVHSLSIIAYGTDYVPMLETLGVKQPKEIGAGMKRNVRLGGIDYPGTVTLTRGLHQSSRVTSYDVTYHDGTHSAYTSRIGKAMNQLFHAVADLGLEMEKSGYPYNQPLWMIHDSAFAYYARDQIYIQWHRQGIHLTQTENFCHALHYEMIDKGPSFILFGRNGVDNTKHPPLSDLGIIFYRDLVVNPKKWQKLGLNPDEFYEYMHSTYKDFLRIKDILSDDPVIAIAQYQIWEQLENKKTFEYWADLVAEYADEAKACVKFKRNNWKSFVGLCFKGSGKLLQDHPQILKQKLLTWHFQKNIGIEAGSFPTSATKDITILLITSDSVQKGLGDLTKELEHILHFITGKLAHNLGSIVELKQSIVDSFEMICGKLKAKFKMLGYVPPEKVDFSNIQSVCHDFAETEATSEQQTIKAILSNMLLPHLMVSLALDCYNIHRQYQPNSKGQYKNVTLGIMTGERAEKKQVSDGKALLKLSQN